MKRSVVLLLLGLCFTLPSFAQPYQPVKSKYHAWLILVDSPAKKKGILVRVNEQSILFREQKSRGHYYDTTGAIEYAAEQIRRIQTRRRSGPAVGAGIGFGMGLITGLLIGFTSDEPESDNAYVQAMGSNEMEAMATAPFTALLGGVAGSLFGLIRKPYPVDGSLQNFEVYREELATKALNP